VLLAAVLFFQQMLIPNLNAAAMRPLGAVAGTAAALLGMIPGVLGAVVGSMIDRQFDGTITPISIGFVISSSVAFAAWRWASSAEQAVVTTPATVD
jgi:DHA1 family bicyclomycin/chloramphenicol resistance-like MFS transporter